MYVIMSYEAVFELPDIYLMWTTCRNSGYVCLAGSNICYACHNGIVHSPQLFCGRLIHLYIQRFLLSAMHVVFDSCSEIGFFIILGWSNCWQDLKITEGIVQVIKGNMDLQAQVE